MSGKWQIHKLISSGFSYAGQTLDSPETGKSSGEGVGRSDTGARGYGGSSPGPQVEEAALELKELQGVQGGMASGQECLQEGTRPSESTSACHVLTYLLLPYPDMLGGSSSGQEGLRGEEQGLWLYKVCGFEVINRE